MRKLVLILFLLFNLSLAESAENLGFTTNLTDRNITKQVDEFYEAIMAGDYEIVKTMLDENPQLVNLNKNKILSPLHVATVNFTEKNKNILNLLLKNGANPNEYIKIENDREAFQFSYPAQILKLNTNFKNKINLLKIFEKYGLNLNNAAIISDDGSVYLPAFIFLYENIYNDDNFEIFDYLAKHRVKPDKALSFIVFLDLGKKTNKLFNDKKFDELEEHLKSSEYLNLRNLYKKYFISAFSNYKVDDFEFDEILNIVIYFMISKDDEILSLLRQNGYLDDKKLQEKIEIFKQQSGFK